MELRLLFILLLAFAPLAHQASAAAAARVYRVKTFDLATDTHSDLYHRLNQTLRGTNSPRHIPPDVQGKVVLGPRRDQFTDRPRAWLMLDAKNGQAKTTLAIALDDLYPLGFRNSAGNWYTVKGFEGSLPNSSTLSFGVNYNDLIGIPGSGTPGHRELYRVPLGNQSAVQAVETLASYDPAATTDQQVKQAFVRFAVMISEAMRFQAIRDQFSGRWEQVTFITPAQAEYVVFWGRLSRLLLNWKRNGYRSWGGYDRLMQTVARDAREIGVHDGADALRLVDFLLRPKPCAPAEPRGRKRPLNC